LDIHVYWNILTMHGPLNVKSPNNTSKWQMGFNSVFKGLTGLCTWGGGETCRLCLNSCVLWRQVMKFCYVLWSIADGFQKIFIMGRVTVQFAGRLADALGLTATSQVPSTQCIYFYFSYCCLQSDTMSLHRNNRRAFITNTECVYCAVRADCLYSTEIQFSL
jgi:hypothetical protein